jgi:MYXO-CTERM domain-containing protein
MRAFLTGFTAFSSLILAAAPAAAATLTVPAMYATPCAAIAAAQPNDTVEISPGTYTDTCAITVAGLTVKGVGGQPKIDLTGGTPSGQKGIYVIDADGVTIENLELTGAQIDAGSGENGAGLRVEASGLTVTGCYIHDNQDGILGTPLAANSTITITSTELAHNGLGDGCDDGNGCTHNVYLSLTSTGFFQTATFQYNWSHDLATDTPDKGHLFKSRAQQTFVLYNRLTGETDTDSYEIDLPYGGLGVIVGNIVEKPPMAGNPISLSYAEEGLMNTDNRIFVVNNTFVNDASSGGPFLDVTNGGVLVAHNDIFSGMGTPSSTGALSADNLAGQSFLFVDAATFDYHLMAGSPAIGMGVNPGSADTFSLTPTEQYVQPLSNAARTDGGKTVGAYPYGATQGTGGSGGAATGSTTGAGGGAASSGGAGGHESTGSASSSSGEAGSKGGCSCGVAMDGTGSYAALLAAVAWIARRRRRRGWGVIGEGGSSSGWPEDERGERQLTAGRRRLPRRWPPSSPGTRSRSCRCRRRGRGRWCRRST